MHKTSGWKFTWRIWEKQTHTHTVAKSAGNELILHNWSFTWPSDLTPPHWRSRWCLKIKAVERRDQTNKMSGICLTQQPGKRESHLPCTGYQMQSWKSKSHAALASQRLIPPRMSPVRTPALSVEKFKWSKDLLFHLLLFGVIGNLSNF